MIFIFCMLIEFKCYWWSLTFTCPLKLRGSETTQSLFHMIEKRWEDNGLVNISGSWSLLEKNWFPIGFGGNLFKYKVEANRYLFGMQVKYWNTGLDDKYVAPILSHQSTGGAETGRPSLVSSDCSQQSSTEALDSALYSASILDHATVVLQLQEIRLVPKQMQ